MKIFVITILLFNSMIVAQEIDHEQFSNILKKYNYNGNVDYQALVGNEEFYNCLKQLSSINPNDLESSDEKLTFWINVYNAFTIKAIVNNYPVESINDLHSGGRILGHIFSTTVWDDDFIIISDKEYSLNDIEHKILRKEFKEPRIHFAIVCASISCPQLRYEAFTNSKIEEQLQDQAIQFFNDETKNSFDVENKIANLSKILDWFEEDFGDNDKEVLLFVSKFIDEKIKLDIEKNLEDWSIDYLDYDWGLNEHKIN